MNKAIAAVAVGMLILSACGGGSDGSDPAAFEGVDDKALDLQCVTAPVNVPNIGIAGQQVEGVKDVTVCTDVKVSAGIVPEVNRYDDCGDPCYAIIVRDFDIAADAKIEIKVTRTSGPMDPIVYDPDPVEHSIGNGRVCVVEVGGPPAPCSERITAPENVAAEGNPEEISLQWRASVHTGDDDVVGYDIWRSEDDVNFTQIATVGETAFTDGEVVEGTTYYYFVVAFDSAGNRSQQSEKTSATAE